MDGLDFDSIVSNLKAINAVKNRRQTFKSKNTSVNSQVTRNVSRVPETLNQQQTTLLNQSDTLEVSFDKKDMLKANQNLQLDNIAVSKDIQEFSRGFTMMQRKFDLKKTDRRHDAD